MVAAFQQLIQRKYQELGERAKYYSSAKIIDHEIGSLMLHRSNDHAETQYRRGIAYTMVKAWEAIAYDHYGRGSASRESEERFSALVNLSDHCQRTGQTTITLSEPQRQILEALAEAANIPHRKGQTEIEIPEKLRAYRYYEEWLRESRNVDMRLSYDEWFNKTRRNTV
jgi:hypothetical protein